MATQHRPYQGYPYTNPYVTEVPCDPTRVTPTTPPGRSGAGGSTGDVGRYQGYPYTNPHVNDAPSVDAATASRWAHLPRRALEARNNVIYVDMPEEGGSSQVTRNIAGSSQSRDPPDKKADIDDNPVIYIDVPEGGSSDITQPTEPEEEPEYVRDTIFYNPFDNRRIDQEKDVESGRSSDTDSVDSGTPRPIRPAPRRPLPPNTLNLTSPGSSSGYSSGYNTTPGLPPSMSKEAYVYGRQPSPDDGFPLSPIPISEFPQPPPAYTEIESPVSQPADSPVPVPIPTPVPPVEPPRTVVITPGSAEQGYRRPEEPSPIGLPNPYRKVVYCHHCGLRVHTLVIRQTGTATHVVALTALCIGLFPLTILVYCTDTCKNKNHYCPNCNKMIGYEVPILCQNMTFTK